MKLYRYIEHNLYKDDNDIHKETKPAIAKKSIDYIHYLLSNGDFMIISFICDFFQIKYIKNITYDKTLKILELPKFTNSIMYGLSKLTDEEYYKEYRDLINLLKTNDKYTITDISKIIKYFTKNYNFIKMEKDTIEYCEEL